MSSVLILGATSDLGRELGIKFASKGYNIILAARKTESIELDKKDLETRFDVKVELKEFDIEKLTKHKEFFDSFEEKPEVVISVVGYLGEQKKSQEKVSEAKRVVLTNYLGQISILELFAQHYEEQEQGVIIGVSSVAGDRGRKANYIYGSAKAGFTTFLSGLRNRLYEKNVHVMTVKPGFMYTKMTEGMELPEKLTITPKEGAEYIFKGFEKQKNVLYIKPIWALVMLVIKHIPEFIFKRLSI